MSIVKRREREKKQRENDIINAAEKLFFSKGYDDVSMNDIAQEVELSTATLYLYFQNKESLYFAIVLHGTRILNEMIKEEVDKAKTGIDKVAAFRKAYYEFTNQYPDYIRIYNYFQSGRFNISSKKDIKQEELDDEKKNLPMPYAGEYTQQILQLRKERFKILCNSVQDGIDDGTIRSDVDPVEIAVLLSSISKNISNMPPDHEKLLERRKIPPEKYFADIGELINHMIRKE
ncbi:MAG TPA: TetR/AcrR family transcriptional regulator [Methanobacterium sp.]